MPEPEEYGIWHYPHLAELEEFIVQLKNRAVESLVEEDHNRAETAQDIALMRGVVHEDWGRGWATPGENILEIFLFFGWEEKGTDPHMDPQFDNAMRAITERMHTLISQGEADIPPEFEQWFPDVIFSPVAISRFEDQIQRSLGNRDGNRLYDINGAVAIEQREEVSLDNLPTVPLEELRSEGEPEEEVEEEPEPEEEEEPEPEPEEEEEPEEEVLYPSVPPFLRGRAVSETKAEVPVGKKDTKSVDVRDPYGFEVIQATGVPNPEFLEEVETDYSADTSIQAEVMDGIGQAKRAGRFDPSHPENVSPGTFPRTGVYIRNYLKFNGPSYALEMHNDFAIYCQFVNNIYNYNLRIGTYQSFRTFLNRLKKLPEYEGPQLIRAITDAEASDIGLEVLPDHPKVDGAKAPWLENRQFYEINPDTEDSPVWENPFDYIYSE